MRTTRRIMLTGALSIGLLVGPLAGLALAHVEVSPDEATQGGSATLTFEVPTEKDIPTVSVAIAIPAETPIATVSAPAMDGWTSNLTTAAPTQPVTAADGTPAGEVVSRVTWTASGDGIAPEQSADFVLDVAGLPRTDTMVFKVLQTYADGSVVSWIEEQPPGAAEPEYPAPVLSLAPGTDATSTTAAASPTSALAGAASSSNPSAPVTTSPTRSSATPSAPVSSSTATSAAATVAATSSAAPVAAAASSSDSSSTVPVVVAVVAVVVIAAGGAWWVLRRRRAT